MPRGWYYQLRRDTAANWASTNPTPGAGEPGLETDGVLKVGDGSSAYADLPFWPQWVRKDVSYTDLQTAGTTKTFKIYTLPKKGVVHGCNLQVTTAFAGTAIVTLAITVGDAGSASRYHGSVSLLSTGIDTSSPILYEASSSATTDINIYATSVGANLSALSQGAMSVWMYVSRLP